MLRAAMEEVKRKKSRELVVKGVGSRPSSSEGSVFVFLFLCLFLCWSYSHFVSEKRKKK